ncbi:MAG: hypothetical protein DSZ27_00905 [Thiomicrospira sp.]|nr:MAG: hypothetical protein DSZ27_00905 [Thiomicrospira sp.]
MTKNNNKLLLEAQQGLTVQSVDLRGSEIYVAESFSSNTVNQFDEVDVQSRKDFLMMKYFHDGKDQAGFLALEYTFGKRVVRADQSLEEEPEVLLEIAANFSANYLIDKEAPPSKEAVQVFVEQNGLFHVWPYWREYVQSSCSRIGVPPIPVEMRPGSVSIKELKEQDAVKLPTK